MKLSASSWHGGGNCRNQCATRIADLARHQPLDMDGPALAHNNKLPPVESATVVVVDDSLGPDDSLDRKFLNNNNNNSPSMKCLQYITPPPADPPPPPALLFDYVVEKSVQQQQQHNLLDSEIKRLENVSFNCNSDEQSANSQVDVQVAPTNSPSIKSRPVEEEQKQEQVGPSKTGTTAASERSSNDGMSAPSVTMCDTRHPNKIKPPPLPSITTTITNESPATQTKPTNESPKSPGGTSSLAAAAAVAMVVTASAAAAAASASAAQACSSKPPIHTNTPYHHPHHPPRVPHVYHHPHNPTASHSIRFMTQHIKILPKTQSLDLVDNDDLLEATNRSESQLDIHSVGLAAAGVAFRGRVLPKLQTLDQTRPIYPNVPYSPYNSPYGSPRSGRRRTPLRESRRVSIEQTGSFLQLNQYKLLDQIGQGSYGLVKLAYSEEDSTHYAMKILSKRKLLRKAGLMRRGPKRGTSPLDRVYREIAVLKKLDHPNVVKLVEVLDDPLEDSLYLVFELVQHGEVLSIPTDSPLSEDRAWNVCRDVILGVEYLHYQRIIHGDLKPANLLLSDSSSVKVADLGVCNEFLGEDAAMNNGSTAGTPAFRSPETLFPGQHVYNGKAADIWALGATLYSLVHGNVPFIATSVPGVYEKIKYDPLEFPPTSTISPELRDLIVSMLDKDPQTRITLPQIKQHNWITKHGLHPLPSEEENCRLVQINDEDMDSVVKSIPKLDTLILIKTMLKKHSFQNPFTKGISGRAPQAGGSRIERFSRSGRSNSAPGDYHTSERQPSNESLLPSVTEGVSSPGGGSPEEQSPYRQIPSIISTPSQDWTATAGPEPEPEPVQPDPTPATEAATHTTVNDDVITA
ncbi:calcium/calmodulin-dependent protein kinase kinase [Culex quinquefasciatus]|uniref:calcium/calmodulin-dependent protein kinase n=1 Tax=Culex quinquefasciatus TaxID=7176 RepID=B0X1T7_CULQU|nr:calcium/calmodulin-dependent protein kinase kinase [Culex quinquefasciatus]|eukprot:XP_001863609.1 calcium/calmodulin-dependent protein kinase kinase [Culex quinquefasciatus]